eukprot:5309494-Amphidinium_carterae.1
MTLEVPVKEVPKTPTAQTTGVLRTPMSVEISLSPLEPTHDASGMVPLQWIFILPYQLRQQLPISVRLTNTQCQPAPVLGQNPLFSLLQPDSGHPQ